LENLTEVMPLLQWWTCYSADNQLLSYGYRCAVLLFLLTCYLICRRQA